MTGDRKYSLADLRYLMARLRDPDSGCPWDLQQDFKSIATHTLEECYELIDALETGDNDAIRAELGDLLFQVVFYAQLGGEQAAFDFDDVVDDITAKLVRRHPHVFPGGDLHGHDASATEIPAVKARWEAIKAEERNARGLHSVLDDVPTALPALTRAAKLQKRSARLGLDWSSAGAVVDALREEIAELCAAMSAENHEAIAHEIGDVLFAAVNLSRHLDCDAEQVLRAANRRFEARVRGVERMLAERGDDAPVDEQVLDALWQRAKRELLA